MTGIVPIPKRWIDFDILSVPLANTNWFLVDGGQRVNADQIGTYLGTGPAVIKSDNFSITTDVALTNAQFELTGLVGLYRQTANVSVENTVTDGFTCELVQIGPFPFNVISATLAVVSLNSYATSAGEGALVHVSRAGNNLLVYGDLSSIVPMSNVPFNLTAGVNLLGQTVVASSSGTAYYPDLTNPTDVQNIVGVTVGAAASGASVPVITSGTLTEGGWSWSPGPIYCNVSSGTLTQTIAGTGAIIEIAKALTPTTIVVEIQRAILR